MADSDRNIQSDYEYSRKIYYDLIETGQEALSRMIDVADDTAHPRSYEVLSGMIKNISDVNDRLMDLHKKNKEIRRSNNPRETPLIGDGSTKIIAITATDLQRQLIENQKDSVDKYIVDITPNNE